LARAKPGSKAATQPQPTGLTRTVFLRIEPTDFDWLDAQAKKVGLKQAEVLRRGIKWLRKEHWTVLKTFQDEP